MPSNLANPEWVIPIKNKWFRITAEDINILKKQGRRAEAEAIQDRISDYQKNKLRFFLPHGLPYHANELVIGDNLFTLPPSDYPEEYGHDGVAFLNDYNSHVCMMVAPNQCGKSVIGVIWILLRILPCNPKWEIFTENHVLYKAWTKPRIAIIATYSWGSMEELWDKYLEFAPQDELGNYARGAEKRKEIKFGDGKPKRVEFKCGSKLIFLCYSQKQSYWESFPSDYAQLDEQIPENKFTGWMRSTTTRGNDTQCCMTLTGHVLDDRPDTGAGGWIKRKLYDGTNTMGLKVARYHMSIETVPDEIITPEKKKELWKRWVDPSIERSEKQQKEAIARYWGGWEEGAGLIFDMFEVRYHVIPPLWDDDKTPKHLPKWRVIDFGSQSITCVSWFALLPTGDGVCYRATYIHNATIAEIAQKMAQLSHNEFRKLDVRDDSVMGITFDYFEEIMVGEEYIATLIDSRSAGMRQYGKTVADIFHMCGIQVTPASGQKDDQQIPRLREWLRIDPDRIHPIRKTKGAPRLFFFETRTQVAINELLSYSISQTNPDKPASRQLDHFIDTAKYWVSENPEQFSNYAYELEKKLDKEPKDFNDKYKQETIIEKKFKGYI